MQRSAGLLLFRRAAGRTPPVEVFLIHPGGPFFARKDLGVWSIPKGKIEAGEEPLAAARRELLEETGFTAEGTAAPLGEITQKSGKRVVAWAIESDCDPARLRSLTFAMEWPPRSKKMIEVPEVDRGAWFSLEEARAKLMEAQRPFLDRLLALLAPAAP